MENFSHVQILTNFCVAEWRFYTEMCHQRHFAQCSDSRGELPNAGLLLTLLNFLTAVFFCSVGQEAGEEVFMFSLFHIPAMQFEFATTHVLFIGTIIMLIWPHANQCWTWLVFMLLHMYLKCTAVKWYTTSFSFGKSPQGLNIQGSYASCSMTVNPIMGFLKPNWRTGQKMGQFN